MRTWRLRKALKFGWSSDKARIAEVLKDSLTEAGFEQWWSSRNRYLDGERPCDVSNDRALEAAQAFVEGAYL